MLCAPAFNHRALPLPLSTLPWLIEDPQPRSKAAEKAMDHAPQTREAFLALLLLSQFSAACTSPALAAFTAEVLPPESRGQAMSIGRTCADVASLCAPVALGVLADSTTCGTSILATAGVCSGCTAVFALRAHEVPVAPPRRASSLRRHC